MLGQFFISFYIDTGQQPLAFMAKAPDASGQDITHRLKCLTLNVLASPVPFNRMEGERFTSLISHIEKAGYEVLAFQELIENCFDDRAGHAARYSSFLTALRELGFVHQVSGPPAHLLSPLDGGIAIFSKHPMVDSSLHHWTTQVSWDAWAAKGVVHALIEVSPPLSTAGACTSVPASRLHVMSLHAQAEHTGWMNTRSSQTYRDVRLQQMKQFAEVVETVAQDGLPVLTLGDFNFDARDYDNLVLHQEVLGRVGNRHALPMDVVASFHDGNHPPTFGLRDDSGAPAETFLTCHSSATSEECLDHVYFWPGEHNHISEIVRPVACERELCPYDGPCNEKDEKPTQVSDHLGWSVELEFAWTSISTASSSSSQVCDETERKVSWSQCSTNSPGSSLLPSEDPTNTWRSNGDDDLQSSTADGCSLTNALVEEEGGLRANHGSLEFDAAMASCDTAFLTDDVVSEVLGRASEAVQAPIAGAARNQDTSTAAGEVTIATNGMSWFGCMRSCSTVDEEIEIVAP